MQIEEAQPYREAAIALLAAAKLPVADLPENLTGFVVAVTGTGVVGVAGVETYGGYGLLRSLAVITAHRCGGIAGNLLQYLETVSRLKGLKELYLLTETAPGYFKRKGYIETAREHVPAEVQVSSEFSHVCPVSAIVLKKNLN